MSPAFQNSKCALRGTAPSVLASLGAAVGNDGLPCDVRGASWFIEFCTSFLAKTRKVKPQFVSPWEAFDLFHYDIAALEKIWPLVKGEKCHAQLSRYLIERMPALWSSGIIKGHKDPVARTLSMADNLDNLISFFNIGIMPTGSKDPYALRRSANYLLRQIMFPVGVDSRGMKLTSSDKQMDKLRAAND